MTPAAPRSTNRRLAALLAAAALPFIAPPSTGADAGEPAIFRDADLALGARLLQTHRCAECHARRVGGDGSSIYDPRGRISTPAALNTMVERCNSTLGLQMFPDEVTAIAAALNRDHYRFGAR